MSVITLEEMAESFFQAVKEHTLLIIIDSKSKGSKAVFSLVYFDNEKKVFYSLSGMLAELGFKVNKDWKFVTHCAGRYSLFILDNIGIELGNHGVELPKWWNKEIQNQNVI